MENQQNQNQSTAAALRREEYEVEIDLKDLLAYILRRWKSILAVGLVCAVLAGGYRYVEDLSSAQTAAEQTAAEQTTETYFSTLSSLEKSLGDEQILEVKEIYAQYLIYRAQFEDSDSSSLNSLLERMETDSAVTYTVEYAFTADRDGIAESFMGQTLDSGDYAAIAEVLGEEDVSLVEQLISVTGSDSVRTAAPSDEDGSASSSNGTAGSDAQTFYYYNYFYTAGEVTNRDFFYVSFPAPDEEDGEEILEIIRAAVGEHAEELVQSGIELELDEVSAVCAEGFSSSVQEVISAARTASTTAYADLKTFESKYVDVLEEEELALFEFYLEYGLEAETGGGTAAEAEAEPGDKETLEVDAEAETTAAAAAEGAAAGDAGDNDASETAVSVSVSAKWVVLGFLGGAGVMILLYLLAYVMSGSVKCVDETARLTGRPVLGVLRRGEYKGINGLFTRLSDSLTYGAQPYEQEAQLQLIARKIAYYAKEKDVSSIYLSVTGLVTEPLAGLLNGLSGAEELKGLTVQTGNPAEDPFAFDEMTGSDAVVLVAMLKQTSRDQLTDAVALCLENRRPIAGSIVVGEL